MFVVDQVGQERLANPQLYLMVVGAIAALAERNSPMVVPAFFLKVLALEGSAPMLDGFGGMLAGSLVVIFVIPMLFVVFERMRSKREPAPDSTP